MTAPFGIDLHSPVAQLEILRELGQGKFSVTPPKIHPSFETYVVQAIPGMGIFWIKGISSTLENDAYGTRVRQLKDGLHTQLGKRYGPGNAVDNLMPGSIWEEARYWTQAVAANERSCYVGAVRANLAVGQGAAIGSR